MRLRFAAAFRPRGCRRQIRAAMNATDRSPRRRGWRRCLAAAARLLRARRRGSFAATFHLHTPSWISPPGTCHASAPEQCVGACFRSSMQRARCKASPRKYISQLPPWPRASGSSGTALVGTAPRGAPGGCACTPADVTACYRGGQPSGVQAMRRRACVCSVRERACACSCSCRGDQRVPGGTEGGSAIGGAGVAGRVGARNRHSRSSSLELALSRRCRLRDCTFAGASSRRVLPHQPSTDQLEPGGT